MGVVEHWAWIPLVACVVMVFIWLTGCTLLPSSTNSAARPTERLTAPPRMTITVYERTPLPVTVPPRRATARIAAQPSPPPSPTPRIYTVRADDTLLDIANQFDVNFQALLLANPDIDPSVLQIGQQLVIPIEGEPPVTLDAPPIAALDLQPPVCRTTSADGVLCLGRVVNPLAEHVEQVRVEVQLFRGDDTVLGTQQVMVEQAYISPGGAAPYRALFPGVDGDAVSNIVATLTSAVATNTVDQRFVPVPAQDVAFAQRDERYTLSAVLANTGGRTANPLRAVVTLLDAQEQVYGYRVWESGEPLLPGAQTQLSLSLSPITTSDLPPALNYELHIEGRAVPPVP